MLDFEQLEAYEKSAVAIAEFIQKSGLQGSVLDWAPNTDETTRSHFNEDDADRYGAGSKPDSLEEERAKQVAKRDRRGIYLFELAATKA